MRSRAGPLGAAGGWWLVLKRPGCAAGCALWRTVAACGVPARAAVSCVQLYWLRAVSLHPACCLPAPPACRAVVAALRALGLRSVLLTGDNRRTAAAIAAAIS